jgi:hypothetical protein
VASLSQGQACDILSPGYNMSARPPVPSEISRKDNEGGGERHGVSIY